jgi:hypothetical protein
MYCDINILESDNLWTLASSVKGREAKFLISCNLIGGNQRPLALEESLSITTGRCDLAIATHARKMHKNLFVVVHPEVLDND